ncbi:MAG: hypothetical protein ABI573_08175 [Chloroflexota bacterium]
MTGRRLVALISAVATVAVAVIGWGIPNLAGPALVDVQLIALPASGAGATTDRTIVLGGTEASRAASVKLAVRVTGKYVLPVTVGAGSMPLRVELRFRNPDGTSKLIWAIEGSAAVLEEGDDSPDGVSTSRAYLIAPGSMDMPIGPIEGVRLLDGDGLPLDAGRYDLRAIAFGVTSGLLPMVILD